MRLRVEPDVAAIERERDSVRGERAGDLGAAADDVARWRADVGRASTSSASARAARSSCPVADGASVAWASSVASATPPPSFNPAPRAVTSRPACRRRTGRVTFEMQLAGERCAERRSASSGTSSASCGASRAKVIRSPAAPRLPFATSVARPALRSIAASCTRSARRRRGRCRRARALRDCCRVASATIHRCATPA